MPKKIDDTKMLVNCEHCQYSGKTDNFLIECSNKTINPKGFKLGLWDRQCKQFKPKK